MIIDFVSFVVFLFVVFQLAKDDFLFLRKGISIESIFNTIFLCLPVVLFSSRLFYVFLHPSFTYLNPLVFVTIPYFPGLSLVGAMIGMWVGITLFTKRKKIPTGRLLDTLSIAFLVSLSIEIFLQGVMIVFTNRLFGIEEIGRSMISVAFFIFVLLQFLRSSWQEGVVTSVTIMLYCCLAFISFGFMWLLHMHISTNQIILTAAFFIVGLGSFVYKESPFRRLRRK